MAIPGFVVRLLPGALLRFAERLRFPQLFLLTLGLFIFDLLIPDFVPFIDELMLALGTLLLASIRKRAVPEQPTPKR